MALKVKNKQGTVIGSIYTQVVTSSLSTPITSGASITVPTYTVGANNISVFIGGVHCSVGREYNEVGTSGASSTTITFTSNITTSYTVDVVVRR